MSASVLRQSQVQAPALAEARALQAVERHQLWDAEAGLSVQQEEDVSRKTYIVRRASETPEERSTCGYRKRLITGEDFEGANVTFLSVYEAERHYHRRSTEIYYVLKGAGSLELNGDSVDLEPGTLVMIPPGTRHHAEGELEVLIVGVPPFDPADTVTD